MFYGGILLIKLCILAWYMYNTCLGQDSDKFHKPLVEENLTSAGTGVVLNLYIPGIPDQ